MNSVMEALRAAFAALGVDIAAGVTWVEHKTPWNSGRRRIVSIGYDKDGHEIGRTVTDKTDDDNGHTTSTSIFYDPQGHETGRLSVDKLSDPDGNTITTTTRTDRQGHVVSQVTR